MTTEPTPPTDEEVRDSQRDIENQQEQEDSQNKRRSSVTCFFNAEDSLNKRRSSATCFPNAFYDPNTGQIMSHPVVGPDGVSIEKSDGQDASVFYPNRALEELIEDRLDKAAVAGSFRGTVMQWQESMRSMRIKFLEKTAIPSREYQPLPKALYCPISFELMHQPVIGPDGATFEKAAILHWLQSNSESPISRSPLKAEQLYENKAILDIIENLTHNDNLQETHESIRNWKEVHSTQLKQSAAEESALNAIQEEEEVNTTNTPATPHRPSQYARNRRELRRNRIRQQMMMNLTGCGILLSLIAICVVVATGVFQVLLILFLPIGVLVCDQSNRVRQPSSSVRSVEPF